MKDITETNFSKESICSKTYQVSLYKILIFELKSLCGRVFFSRKFGINKNDRNLLNLGCGRDRIKDFVNADFFYFGFSSILKEKQKPDWVLDLRFPLNCDDSVWDGVFTEHTLEHLYPDQVKNLLQELHRTMKPGAWIRITVPDLKKYVYYYSTGKVHSRFTQWKTGCEALRSLTQSNFHLSLWDYELLEQYLSKSGFINVQEVAFMQGNDISLLKDREDRAWETLYVEAQKPL